MSLLLSLERGCLLFQVLSPLFLLDVVFGNGWAKQFGKFLHAVCQRLDRLFVPLHSLGYRTGQSCDAACGRGSYLAIFEDKTETAGDRLEGTEGICRISHSAEEHFSSGQGGGLPARILLV